MLALKKIILLFLEFLCLELFGAHVAYNYLLNQSLCFGKVLVAFNSFLYPCFLVVVRNDQIKQLFVKYKLL